jgi:diaminopimelate epimerase
MRFIEFTKMHGLGNDFILLDAFINGLPRVKYPDFSQKICARTTGIGADGLILIMPGGKANFRMRIYNSDGSQAEMCGNGFRCMIRYIYERGYTDKKTIAVDTLAGIITGEIVNDSEKKFTIRVAMGVPEFKADRIPLRTRKKEIIDGKITIAGMKYTMTAVSIGNPHAVLFVDDWYFDWKAVGKKIENHRLFPAKANVEFVEILSRKKLIMRSWERGAGPTLASGTGSCAAVAAGIRTGRLDNKVQVQLKLGSLRIEQDKKSGLIFKTGPAEYICTGRYFY